MVKASLFTHIAESLRNAKKNLGTDKTIKVVISTEDWKCYNDEDIVIIIFEAAKYSIGVDANETEIMNDFEFSNDGDVSSVTITIENQ